jgi:hypothetical protein
LSPVVAGLNGGGGGVGDGGGRTVGTAFAPELPGVPGAPGCSGRGGRRLVGGERPGVGAGALSGHQPHCPAAGTEEDRGGPTVAARMPGDTTPLAQGLRAREPGCLEAAPVGIVFRPVIFDLGVGPVGGWSSRRGEVAGRDGGSSSVFLAGASGLGWLLRGSCHSGVLGGWRPG